ncbi:hypothetical protein [Thermincola ferriacetica]|nr:hypothetical protein [Thermincola ferriacetica]
MKFKKISIFLYLLGCLAILGGLAYNNIRNQVPTQQVSASWTNYYANPDELFDAADVVVKGKVKKVGEAFVKHEPDVITTNVIFEPKEVYKNTLGKDLPTEITIDQDGGIYKGVNYKVDKVEILEEGKNYVLFLRYAADQDLYCILSGYQGQFKIKGDKAENPAPERSMDYKVLEQKIKEKQASKKKE